MVPGAFFPDPGGAQVQAHNLSNFLSEKKNSIDMFLFKKTNVKNFFYKIRYFNLLTVNIVFFFHYYLKIDITFVLRWYLKSIVEKKYSAWHFIFLNYKSLLLINCLKKLNQKIVVTFQGADVQIKRGISYGNRIDKNYEILLKKTLPKINIFTSISKTIYKELRLLDIPKKKIIHIPNGIILSKFKNTNLNKNKILNLITVARYANKKKGYDLLPKIAMNLIKKKINFCWTVIGSRTDELYKNKIIIQNSEKFKILNNLNYSESDSYYPNNKIINYYKNSTVYVNLARIESFGITFVESLASNIPIVTFDTKGANEIIKNNYNGFVIKGTNLNKFTEKLLFLNKKRNFFKKNPYNSVEKFDFKNLYKLYLGIYKNL